jgi:hypothetical protein
MRFEKESIEISNKVNDAIREVSGYSLSRTEINAISAIIEIKLQSLFLDLPGPYHVVCYNCGGVNGNHTNGCRYA